MILVSNTTPLSSLASINRIDILTELFGTIHIADAVYQELRNGGFSFDSSLFSVYPQISSSYQQLLRRSLDEGETQTILLAQSIHADLVLIDERRGNALAKTTGLNVGGTLSVLITAKQQGIITAVKPFLDAFIANGQWYSPRFVAQFLVSIGE